MTEKEHKTMNESISRLLAKGGPDFDEYQGIVDIVENLPDEDIGKFREAVKPILNPSSIIGFSYTKPFGYSGDFFIIEKIYQKYANPDKRYTKWDVFFHSFPTAGAVVNRKTLAKNIFKELDETDVGIAKDILVLGSGPVTETHEYFEENPNTLLSFDMIDLDKRAIAYAKNKIKKYESSVTFSNVNVIRYTPEKKYDLIWSAGLFDYFKGKHFVYLLKKYYQYLNEGGEIIIGNFNKENKYRRLMEVLGDWFLYHRSVDELKEYALQAGFDEDKIEVIMEPLGINLFLRIKK